MCVHAFVRACVCVVCVYVCARARVCARVKGEGEAQTVHHTEHDNLQDDFPLS